MCHFIYRLDALRFCIRFVWCQVTYVPDAVIASILHQINVGSTDTRYHIRPVPALFLDVEYSWRLPMPATDTQGCQTTASHHVHHVLLTKKLAAWKYFDVNKGEHDYMVSFFVHFSKGQNVIWKAVYWTELRMGMYILLPIYPFVQGAWSEQPQQTPFALRSILVYEILVSGMD